MRTVVSLSVPEEKLNIIKKIVKERKFKSLSEYFLYSVEQEQKMISEDELYSIAQKAKKDYKA